jgi:putative ABC transport system permease protein
VSRAYPFLRLLPYVAKTVRRAPVRSLLTVLGTALALAIFAFVRTLDLGVDAFERAANKPVLVVFQQSRFCPLTSELPSRYRSEIERMDGVEVALPTTIFVNKCQSNYDLVTLHGVDPMAIDRVEKLTVLEGEQESWRTDQGAVLVGWRLAERRKLKVGDPFRMQNLGLDLRVKAIVDGDGPGLDNVAFVHERALQEPRDMVGRTTQYLVKLKDGADPNAVAKHIDERFASDEAPTDTKTLEAFVQGPIGEVAELVRFARLLGYLAVVVVVLVLSNTIFISAQARAQEMGTLEAIGLGKARLAGLVVAEGLLLAGIGGLVGSAAVVAFFTLQPTTLGVEGFGIDFVAGPGVIVSGVLASLVVGFIASIPPAVEVVVRPVVEALRPS